VELDAIVKRISAGWRNLVVIRAVDRFADLPADIQENARAQGSDGSDVRGVFHEGTIYLVGKNIPSALIAERTLPHEAYGHLGLRLLSGGANKSRTRLCNSCVILARNSGFVPEWECASIFSNSSKNEGFRQIEN
jgi:hypothetical protein